MAPGRREAIARAAQVMAGLGQVAEAGAVAGAAVDADPSPIVAEPLALAARLAIDDAIAMKDEATVRRRVTRARLPLEEAAGRALLAAQPALARSLAGPIVAADPTARGARLVLAAASGGSLIAAAADARSGDAPSSAAGWVAFGAALVHAVAPEQARVALANMPHDGIIGGDDRVVRAAVELVSRGALDVAVLPPDGAVELAALRGESATFAPAGLDARHEYLARSLSPVEAERARELGTRLANFGADDRIVAAAAALVQLGTGTVIAPDAPRALLSRDPTDPLLAAVALRLAERVGDVEVAQRARAMLTAVGGKPRPKAE